MRALMSTSIALPWSRRWSRLLVGALAATSLLTACQRDKGKPGAGTGSAGASTGSATTTATTGVADLDSKDILARAETADSVMVKHILIGWKDLTSAYPPGQMDKRAAGRTNAEAAALAKDLLGKITTNFAGADALVAEHSEDPGSKSGDPYEVTPRVNFVPEFKKLALRLKEKEAGIVKTSYGYHVMFRVPPPPPPPPDPLESADILARPAEAGPMQVQHILVGWKDTKRPARDPRAQARTKADADKLAGELLAKVRAGGDMVALMKEHSEDPGSKDTGKAYDVTPDAGLVPPFKNLSLRLQLNEAGLVKTDFGWHVIKRVPPPPPDPLESADILARAPVTDNTKVKHILLGWKELNAGDDRGKNRDRKALEALVKKTMASLKKGAKIEPLMKELSEDPGSAASGESYDVTPTAGLVPPFKNLSLRLKPGEVGAVKTDYGIHIIQRVADETPAPAAPSKQPPAAPTKQTAPAKPTPTTP